MFGAISWSSHEIASFKFLWHTNLDPISSQDKTQDVKNKLYKLYDHYVIKQNGASDSSNALNTSSEARSKSKGVNTNIWRK